MPFLRLNPSLKIVVFLNHLGERGQTLRILEISLRELAQFVTAHELLRRGIRHAGRGFNSVDRKIFEFFHLSPTEHSKGLNRRAFMRDFLAALERLVSLRVLLAVLVLNLQIPDAMLVAGETDFDHFLFGADQTAGLRTGLPIGDCIDIEHDHGVVLRGSAFRASIRTLL